MRTHHRLGRAILLACGALGAMSLVTVLIAFPNGAPVSRDPGAPAIPWWVTLLPAAVGILLTLVLPARAAPQPAIGTSPARLASSIWALVAIAALFPALVLALDLGGSPEYLLMKFLVITVAAAVVVAVTKGVRIDRASGPWRWWAPALVIVVWTVLSQVAPWNPALPAMDIDPVYFAVAALLTALTAGVGEELFYRRWLQTRLEAALGAWPGIALTALLFALMHLGSHGSGEVVLDIARVIVAQGSFGLFVGIMWWRYRNLIAIIVVHIIVNGWGAVALLLGPSA
ncbi:type II CAAX endopeptidase family protein [Leucobacter sp. USCH14]|uniref:CPBP family intramembrane glutamic endopeptidase n=1 Tax=Leucobacter sp. USCH14 TaxID=3024838 RepID=UPI0030A7CC14